MVTKPYLKIPIVESGETLLPVPKVQFAHQTPHAYEALGAPYGEASPYFVREQVLDALVKAQKGLQEQRPHWQIFLFDAYRPVAVQEFMVNYAFQEALAQQNLKLEQLTPLKKESLWEQVLQIWALPSLDPKTPPPHSTGGAVDVTLYDRNAQQLIEMGSPIDEMSMRSQPQHFAELAQAPHLSEAERTLAQTAAHHRQILYDAMQSAGFQRHLGEWWHFCLGDQMWAWLTRQQQAGSTVVARYGRI
ncbi:D-alanyl-D-alanine dipeptidase [Acaryochloris thomasi RCC1774]|uniref:D-alanyl-D-alanine dipeptidase n=1 Tax=Acaryochloris thomasi RCC1774 TaxID=1764569 RepID=A0A2W1JBA6_9CYAN|nr:M15 family metallopeptidase [Acaryochloris thomasi]PZD71363.1 D-alanyl-D-alanine dipeptidase [Acaryochloris thomasi RCC1774]